MSAIRIYGEIDAATTITVLPPDKVGDPYAIRIHPAEGGILTIFSDTVDGLRKLVDAVNPALPEHQGPAPDKAYAVVVDDLGKGEIRLENHDGRDPHVVGRVAYDPAAGELATLERVGDALTRAGWTPRNIRSVASPRSPLDRRIVGIAFAPGSRHSIDAPTEQIFGVTIPNERAGAA